MFIGHFAVAFAGKRVAPRISLGTLFFGAQFLDLIWPILVLLGVEHLHIEPGVTKMNPLAFDAYPISHSLLLSLLWALLIGKIYYWKTRYRAGALMLGAAVFSHWVLDWLTHRPDLQLAPGSPLRVGLGLWNHPALTVLIEGSMYLLGVGSYAIQTRARDAAGRWGLVALVLVLGGFYVMNLNAPPPPNARVVAWMALALWLFVPWAAWVDRHRQSQQLPAPRLA
jgi:membrane-bound metal-dependent hydrolase YbcI (DUF457 family)